MSEVIIGDVTPRTQLIATAGQTVFNTNWTVDATTDVNVYARADGVAPDDSTQLVDPADYTVSLVGATETVRVTFSSGRTVDDVITIVRATPIERENLYINTNFTPSMLNQDFGLYTFGLQQNSMYVGLINPRYNLSATIEDTKDTVLPILGASEFWAKDSTNTGFTAYGLPDASTLAPGDAKYILQTSDSSLPNAQDLSSLSSGIVAVTNGTGVFSSFQVTGQSNQIDITNPTGLGGDLNVAIADNPIIGGTEGMGLPSGTTAQRVTPTGSNIGLRYNTDLSSLEYYDGGWIQVEASAIVADLLAELASNSAGQGASLIGLQDQGTVSGKTVQDLSELDIVCATDPTATLLNGVVLSDLALLLAGGTMTGTIDMDSNTITNLPVPSDPAEPATKSYVDGIAFNTIPAANYSTTANLTGYTYDNGTAGVGATLTAGSNGAFSTDGQNPSLNDEILVSFQTSGAENGIYTLTQVGDGSSPAILTRATFYDEASDMQAGDAVTVIAGDTLAGHSFMMNQTAAITVGTTDITWLDITNSSNVVTLSGTQVITGDKTFSGSTVLGTPASGTLTNCTGLPISGITGLGTGVGTALAANVTGTGGIVLDGSPTLTTPDIGTPSGGTLSNCTDLPISTGVSGLGTGVATGLGNNVTGSGGPVLDTSPSLTTPTLGVASATSLDFSSTDGIIGTTTNDDASAGSVGEFATANVASGSAISLTHATAADVTSISLTAGDWDVWGLVSFIPGASTTVTQVIGWTSTTSATLPADPSGWASIAWPASTLGVNAVGVHVFQQRYSLSSTTTIYLSAQSSFGTSTMSACGTISARRVR